MRSLGEFFGHIMHAAKTDVSKPTQRAVLRHDVEEQEQAVEGGSVTLRRTTIEEVEVRANSTDDVEKPGP